MRRQEDSVTAEETSAVAPDAEGFRLAAEANSACIEFLHDLVTLPSPSRGERLACERVVREMGQLAYQTPIDGPGMSAGSVRS
jgi:hypothetical protein